MEDYPHLDDAARSAIALPVDERIQKLRHPHWIAYPHARRIFDKLEDLLGYPRMHRMPNLLIVGETNNGKTVIVSRFQRLHKADDNPAAITPGSRFC
jgi:Bacterial TniB protein